MGDRSAVADDVMRHARAQWRAWRANYVQAVRDIWPGTAPTDQQVMILQAANQPQSRVAIKSGKGTGKTCSFAWIVLLDVLLWDDFKGLATAPTGASLTDGLWPEVMMWHSRMPEPLQRMLVPTTDHLYQASSDGGTNKAGSFYTAKTAVKERPEAMRGIHARRTRMIADEASGISDEILSLLSGNNGHENTSILLASQANRVTGYFYNVFNRFRDLWTCITLSSEDSPYADRNHKAELIASCDGDEDADPVRVDWWGEFPRSDVGALISRELCEEAAARSYAPNEYAWAPRVVGCDVGGLGTDRHAVWYRQGPHAELLLAVPGNQLEHPALAQRVSMIWRDKDLDGCIVEHDGIGQGLIMALRAIGRHPLSYKSCAKHPASSPYANERARAWHDLRDWMRDGGSIPDDPELIEELTAVKVYTNSAGKLQLEPKEHTCTRIGRSPDKADGLVTTVGARVESRSRQIAEARLQMADRQEMRDHVGGRYETLRGKSVAGSRLRGRG